MLEVAEIIDVSAKRELRAEGEQIAITSAAAAQRTAHRRKITNQLTGRGGVALIMYHLARLGLEFTPTAKDSDAADLWVQTGSGAIATVEVKATSGVSWLIKANQLGNSEFYALVDIRGASVWIIRAVELKQLLTSTTQRAAGGIYTVTRRQLPREAEGAWSLFTGSEPDPVTVIKLDMRRKKLMRMARRERRVLRSGEVKIYEYPAVP